MPAAELCLALLAAQPPAAVRLPAAARAAAGLAVHRQTVRHALLEALRSAFCAVEQALGTVYFAALAAQFFEHAPPRSPVLHEYGADFADFVASFPPLIQWPWLSDLARLEWARREVFYAADATPLAAEHLRTIPTDALLQARCTLHPAWQMVASAFPLDALWQAQQSAAGCLASLSHTPSTAAADTLALTRAAPSCRLDGVSATPSPSLTPRRASRRRLDALATNGCEKGGLDVDLPWQPSTVQVWRSGFAVCQRRLTRAETELRNQLRQGCSFFDALAHALAHNLDNAAVQPAEPDAAALLRALIEDGLIVALRLPSTTLDKS